MTLVEVTTNFFSVWQYLDFFIRIVVACLCGACIGVERSKRFKEAGIRTHIIVCAAAALMMIVSKYAFVDLVNPDGTNFAGIRGADSARIAAQVVSGVSFLGAGVIFKNGTSVKGLTTAAGIWITAGIGLAIGAGLYPIAIFVTVFISVLQILMHKFKIGADATVASHIRFTVRDTPDFHEKFHEQLKEWKATVTEITVSRTDSGYATYDVTLRMPNGITLEDFDSLLKTYTDVRDYSIIPVL